MSMASVEVKVEPSESFNGVYRMNLAATTSDGGSIVHVLSW